MGNNMNLCDFLGVPDHLICPKCKKEIESGFDDYDIEMWPELIGLGEVKLHVYCNDCDHEFGWECYLNMQDEKTLPEWNT